MMSKLDIKLLPHQFEVISDTQTKVIALVSGYGGGKTFVACKKAIQLARLNAGFNGIITEPTYPMLRDIFIPEMIMALEFEKVQYTFNKSNSIFTLKINGLYTKIICMSAENYERLVGINGAWAIMDEFDTSKTEIALKAYQKILGRLRVGNTRQLIITTTPEGFRATYQIFVKEKDKGDKRLIKARTTDNYHLPTDFIDTLREQYPPNLLEAYLNGEFINLANETIYTYFDRSTHHKDVELQPFEVIHIGQDFNYNGNVSTLFVIRDNIPFMFDEIISKDTYDTVANIKERYSKHSICIYPDASGKQNQTNATLTDIQILKNGGFTIYAKNVNPRVQDRINSANALFSHNKVFVDVNKCPKTVEALEQQSYDEKGNPEKFNGSATVDDFCDSFTYFISYKFPLIRNNVTSSDFLI